MVKSLVWYNTKRLMFCGASGLHKAVKATPCPELGKSKVIFPRLGRSGSYGWLYIFERDVKEGRSPRMTDRPFTPKPSILNVVDNSLKEHRNASSSNSRSPGEIRLPGACREGRINDP